MTKHRILAAVVSLALLTIQAAPVETKSRPGKVQLSNGDVIEGNISLTPGSDLKLHVNTQIRTLDLDRVQEIRVAPVEEQMVQKWRFLEAGQTKKEFSGLPYLIRTLQATVVLAGGEKITGHLYTTVFYVEGPEKTQKVILFAKQRGKEGEGANTLIYPAMIHFDDTAEEARETIRLRVQHPGFDDKTEIAAQTWGTLFTFDGKKTGQPGEYVLASPLGHEIFLAAKTGNSIVAGWPRESDPKILALVRANLAIAEDFFDDRKLLGVFLDKPNSDIYSLLMLTRKGGTTLEGNKTQPWRLVILRWKYDAETQRVLLAGRGFFFRGILAKGEKPPEVQVSEALWGLKKAGDVWVPGK